MGNNDANDPMTVNRFDSETKVAYLDRYSRRGNGAGESEYEAADRIPLLPWQVHFQYLVQFGDRLL